jgi:bifunctional oligoribonuclease and PAP phosphatase NrnA
MYDFLAGADRVRPDPEPSVEYDLLVVSDCGTLERTGSVLVRHRDLLARLPRVTIDHHVSNDASGEADWIDPAAAATCEMVALLSHRLGVPLTAGNGELATNLMSGIVMDTATFQHPNTTPRTLIVGAALLEAGAWLSEISRRLYRSKPTSQLRLFGRVLNRLDATFDGLVIWSTLLDEDLLVTVSMPTESEGIIDLMAQSTTAEVAILFKEAGASTRLSVRTRPGGVDATVLTGHFGGGGHARAAGATVDAPLDVARPLVLAEAGRLAALVVR